MSKENKIKIKRAYSLRKLRKNITFMCKGDRYFRSACGRPLDIFFHIYDGITKYIGDAKFYVFYYSDLPVAYVAISRKTKYMNFYVDPNYRSSKFLTAMFQFVESKLGQDFVTGTRKTNDRFIAFAERNKWGVLATDDTYVYFKGRTTKSSKRQ